MEHIDDVHFMASVEAELSTNVELMNIAVQEAALKCGIWKRLHL